MIWISPIRFRYLLKNSYLIYFFKLLKIFRRTGQEFSKLLDNSSLFLKDENLDSFISLLDSNLIIRSIYNIDFLIFKNIKKY